MAIVNEQETVTLEPGTTTSLTMNVGTVTDGNLLIALCSVHETVNLDISLTLSGWTKIDQFGNESADSNRSDQVIAAWWRVASSEPSSYEIDATGMTVPRAVQVCIELSGCDNTTPIHKELFSGTTTGSQASPQIAAEVTTTIDDCYAIAAFSTPTYRQGTHSTTGTGWTQILDADNNATGPDDWDSQISYAGKLLSGQGATGDVSENYDSTLEGSWFQIAIAPEASTDTTIEVPLGPVW